MGLTKFKVGDRVKVSPEADKNDNGINELEPNYVYIIENVEGRFGFPYKLEGIGCYTYSRKELIPEKTNWREVFEQR